MKQKDVGGQGKMFEKKKYDEFVAQVKCSDMVNVLTLF